MVEANGEDNCSLPQHMEVPLREGPLPCLVKNRSLLAQTGATANSIPVQSSWEVPSVNLPQGRPEAAPWKLCLFVGPL